MIRVIRRFKAQNTGGEERAKVLRSMRSLLNEKHTTGYQVHISRLGELGVITWTADFDSLAAFEKWQADVLGGDQEWLNRYNDLGDRMLELGLIIPGTAEDLVYTKLD